MKALLRTIFLLLTLTAPALAEKLVDPTTVAPEYREAAEKRRAERSDFPLEILVYTIIACEILAGHR